MNHDSDLRVVCRRYAPFVVPPRIHQTFCVQSREKHAQKLPRTQLLRKFWRKKRTQQFKSYSARGFDASFEALFAVFVVETTTQLQNGKQRLAASDDKKLVSTLQRIRCQISYRLQYHTPKSQPRKNNCSGNACATRIFSQKLLRLVKLRYTLSRGRKETGTRMLADNRNRSLTTEMVFTVTITAVCTI